MNELEWREAFKLLSGKIEYRVCSERISWRSANNFTDVYSALFGNDGAYKMFNSYNEGLRVEDQRKKYGNAHYCAVWVDSPEIDVALLINEDEIALVSRKAFENIQKASVYNYNKWDQDKRAKEESVARQTRDKLGNFFESSKNHLPFTQKSFHAINSPTSSDGAGSKLDLSSDITESDIVEDVLKALGVSVGSTDSLSLVKSRVGQGVFRSKLVDYWHACAVTGCESIRLLKASHIKPWANSDDYERLDVYNGLLLVPGIDTAFDYGFITFSPDGAGKISDELSVDDRIYLGIYNEKIFLKKIEEAHQKYLCFHNEHVFEKWKK